jgi:thioredoxin-related protein
MRKLFIISAFIIGFSQLATGQTDSIRFLHKNIESVLAEAKSLNKPVFLDAYTTWCGPCKQMAKDVFTVDRVAQYFNQTFVNTKVDMEKGEGLTLRAKYKIVAYPTFLLLDSDGNELHRIVGSSGPDDFINSVREGLGNNSLAQLELKYKQNENDKAFAAKYIKKLSAAYKYDEALMVADTYYNSLSYNEKTNTDNWFLFENRRLTNYGSDRYNFLLANRKAFHKSVGNEKVEKLIYSFMAGTFSPFLLGHSEYNAARMKTIKLEIIKNKPVDSDDLNLLFKLTTARGEKNFSEFINLVDKNAAKANTNTFETIVRVMGFISEEGGTKEQCVEAASVLGKFSDKPVGESQKEYFLRVINYLNRGPHDYSKNKKKDS